MNKYAIFATLGLIAGGLGIGAGVAKLMVGTDTQSFRQSEPNPTETFPVKTATTAVACSANSLNIPRYSLSSTLNGIGQATAIAANPFPTFQSLNDAVIPDLVAIANPAPFPKISDRARKAKVPIIMYHDIAATKQVDWDVTPEELETQFQAIADNNLTPISLDTLVDHLRTGRTLPENPILLTFDDNYLGQFQYALPLLQKYGYPAVFSIHTGFVGVKTTRDHSTWAQLKEMQKSGLITFASHTVNHLNLSQIDDAKIEQELVVSKQVLEKELGIIIRYFTYPEGSYSDRVKEKVKQVGYEAALTMSLDPNQELPAGDSDDLLAIKRYGQSRLSDAIAIAWNGKNRDQDSMLPDSDTPIFNAPIQKKEVKINGFPITLIYGGKPITIHADNRAQVAEIMKQTKAIAAVDGGFFSLTSLQGNSMIGPVLSQVSSNAGQLNIGRAGENPLLKNRPLVLISNTDVKFIPYDPQLHSTKEQLADAMPDVTDAFVAAGWLVKNGKPQPAASFGKLYGFDASRDRAFWGIDRSGRPVVGVTMEMIDSVGLGELLAKAGLKDVVMLDSGASASLAYKGKSLMSYTPRPVPHVVALVPSDRCVPAAVSNSKSSK